MTPFPPFFLHFKDRRVKKRGEPDISWLFCPRTIYPCINWAHKIDWLQEWRKCLASSNECISPSSHRSICQDKIKHTRILLREMPMKEIGEWARKARGSWDYDARLTQSEEARGRRLGRSVLQCSLRKVWQGHQGVLKPKLAIGGIPCLSRKKPALVLLPHIIGWEHPLGGKALAQTWRWISEPSSWGHQSVILPAVLQSTFSSLLQSVLLKATWAYPSYLYIFLF